MVHYLGRYLPNLSEIMRLCGFQMERKTNAFEKVKKLLPYYLCTHIRFLRYKQAPYCEHRRKQLLAGWHTAATTCQWTETSNILLQNVD